MESGVVTWDLPQPLVITGNRFAFDYAGFTPAAGTVYVGTNYRVQQSNPLVPGSWTETGINAPGTGGVQTLTVPVAVTGSARGMRYFRVVGE